MDQSVLRGIAKWPDVPDVFGWLALDRRGEWRLRNPASGAFERIGNPALRGFIARNYARDGCGRWFFQNGPQRVFVRLAYTPLVARLEADGALVDQCGRAFGAPSGTWLDEEGSLLLAGRLGAALLDDRDLERYADAVAPPLESLPRIARAEVAARFEFNPDPAP